MTENRADDATLRQITAADPARSTWLTANAGSGKTRVLTDRVARLLLDGTRPERVLCLTYTKAAATEMQNRLLKRLGEWAMLPDDALGAALADLGVAGTPDIEKPNLHPPIPGGSIYQFNPVLIRLSRFLFNALFPIS